MELKILEQFLLLSKTEHMAETADFFHMSPPALSKNIARLESELGTKLFDRVGRHIRLNKNGENYAAYAKRALQLLQAGADTVKKSQYDILGRIRIRCRAFGPILSPCVAAYAELNPQVEFLIYYRVLSDDSIQEFQETEDDFILCSAREMQDMERESQLWEGKILFPEQMYAVVSASCPALQGKTVQSLSDLRDIPFATQIQRDVFFADTTIACCRQAGFTPQVPFRTDNFLIKMGLVEEGAAAVILPQSCLSHARRLIPDLLEIPVYTGKESLDDRAIVLLHKKEGFMTETARDFWEFLCGYFQERDSAAGRASQTPL